jgi:hypothetical protein
VIHHVSLERYTVYHDTATAPFDETARQVIAEARGIVDMRASRCGIGVGEQIGSSAWRWLMSRQPMRADWVDHMCVRFGRFAPGRCAQVK